MKIENMKSKKGNPVPNQFIIFTPKATFFQSYKTMIVKTTFENGERIVLLDKNYWNCSKTTSKYRNLFLNKTTNEIETCIKTGVYKLVNLN